MIEAELKARVKDVEAVRTWLRARAEEEEATYHDTYYDWPDHHLDTEGREIRLRRITTAAGTRNFMTYKQPTIDPESQSKPEFETDIADSKPIETMLTDLGLVELVSLVKNCKNFRFGYQGAPILATLVEIVEIDQRFLEIETQANQLNFERRMGLVREIVRDLGLTESLDSRNYTDLVIESRAR